MEKLFETTCAFRRGSNIQFLLKQRESFIAIGVMRNACAQTFDHQRLHTICWSSFALPRLSSSLTIGGESGPRLRITVVSSLEGYHRNFNGVIIRSRG